MSDKYYISRYSGHKIPLDSNGKPDFDRAYGSPSRVGSSSSSSRRREEPYRPRDYGRERSVPVREERHYSPASAPEPAAAPFPRLPRPPIDNDMPVVDERPPRERHYEEVETIDVGQNKDLKDSHIKDIEDFIRRAKGDKSGYDWNVRTNYWNNLLERYQNLNPADPDFRQKEKDLRAKTLYTLKKGIEQRKESGIKPRQGGFEKLLDFADSRLNQMPKIVKKLEDLFED